MGRTLPRGLPQPVPCRGLKMDSDPVQRGLGGILPRAVLQAGNPHSLPVASIV